MDDARMYRTLKWIGYGAEVGNTNTEDVKTCIEKGLAVPIIREISVSMTTADSGTPPTYETVNRQTSGLTNEGKAVLATLEARRKDRGEPIL